ncbi:hypothetical protein [Desertivirga arenae]|uniref:hypothetical protein n=1 Tax=Desertivirga arenae TaxID=2810309 RepID=UPI001A976633|nr:hypothetical protein [Pedobacter sp. SYSU D00823]
MTEEQKIAEARYLNNNIYKGLIDYKTTRTQLGWPLFTKEDFEIVLQRAKEQRIGVRAIIAEDVVKEIAFESYEMYQSYPQDSQWYFGSFKKLSELEGEPKFAAWFYVPGNYFEWDYEE